MELSRISISNFRNFSALDVSVAGNVVVVGENRVGKSNLLYALRLLLDPTLSDSARQLAFSDFWDGLDVPAADNKITIAVEITRFEEDLDVLALLTDFRLVDDPHRVRLVYEFRPRVGLEGDPASEEDFEFICYGGEDEAKRFGHDLRRRITMEVLPALRDVEGDLAVWRRSPLRPLIEKAFSAVDADDVQEIADAVQAATEKMTEFDEVRSLEENIGDLFTQMSGSRQDIKPRLGFGPTVPSRLYRTIRLLIDEGTRSISDASLGSANLVFLTLKTPRTATDARGEQARSHIPVHRRTGGASPPPPPALGLPALVRKRRSGRWRPSPALGVSDNPFTTYRERRTDLVAGAAERHRHGRLGGILQYRSRAFRGRGKRPGTLS